MKCKWCFAHSVLLMMCFKVLKSQRFQGAFGVTVCEDGFGAVGFVNVGFSFPYTCPPASAPCHNHTCGNME